MSGNSEEMKDDSTSSAGPESIGPKRKGVSPTMKVVAIAVIVVLLISVPIGYLILSESEEDAADFSVTLIGKADDEEVLDLATLEEMDSVEALSSYQNRFGVWKGLGTYGGVELRNITDMVGGMEEGDLVTLTASDGYSVNLSYEQVYATTEYLAVQGRIILAYELNGSLMSEEDWPMIAVLAPDEAFSNDDFNATAPDGSEFEMQTSAGSLWVKTVSRIEINELQPREVVLTVEGTTTIDFTLAELQSLTSNTSSGAFIKSTGTVVGPSEYTGVPLKDLVDLVCSEDDYSIEVIGTDDYSVTYNYSQVETGLFEHFDESGTSLGFDTFTMVVAYAQDGSPLVDMVLRMAIIDDSEPITNSELWAKDVCTMKVVPSVKEWSLDLNGTTFMKMDRQTFEAIASCDYHRVSWSFVNETGVTHTYTGVALWVLVSAVDGADGPESEFSFNDLLAFSGYNVRVTAAPEPGEDTYSKTFTSMQVARNDSIIVANKLDGEPLPEGEWPVRIVGDWLSSGMKVKEVVNISLEDVQPVPDWELTLTGTRTVVLSAEAFVSMYYSGLHGPWFNYTDQDGPHAGFYTYTDDTFIEHTYTGIPLWMIVAIVDGEDLDHYEFNESLAQEEYDVNVSSGDYGAVLPISTVEYNASIVLAFMFDGELLTDDVYPLRLVGEYLLKSQMVKAVDAVTLVGLPA